MITLKSEIKRTREGSPSLVSKWKSWDRFRDYYCPGNSVAFKLETRSSYLRPRRS